MMPTTIRKVERWSMRTVLAVLLGFLAMRGCNSAVQTIVQTETRVEQRRDSIRYYQDLAGREHAGRMLAIADKETLKEWYGPLVDSLTTSLDIKDKQLESFAAIGTETKGTVPLTVTTEAQPDGDTARRFTYTDRWLDLAGRIYRGSNELTYTIRDSLAFTTYWKRPWLLGRKTYYIDVYSLNPNARISGLQGAQVAREKGGRWGIGPHVGYGLYFDGTALRHGWQGGISINYDVIQF